MSKISQKQLIAVSLLMLMSFSASALDFRSVAVPKAVLYDAPSSAATKVLLLSQQYPVEIVVNLGDWLKVRDAEGGLNWICLLYTSIATSLSFSASAASLCASCD